MAVYNRIKTIAGTLIAVVIVYLAVLNLVDRSNWQQLNEGIEWTQREQGLLVDSVEEGPSQMGIESGDVLVDINGLAVTSLNEYTRVLESLSETVAGEVVADYTVRKHDGREVTAPLLLTLESGLQGGDTWLILSAFIFLGIGLFIFLRNGQARGAFHFYLICIIAFALLLFRYSGQADRFDILVYWISAVAFLILPPTFLHFCYYFPEPTPWSRSSRGVKFGIYLPAVFLLAIHLFWFLGWLGGIGLPRTTGIAHLLDRVELTYFLFFLGLAGLSLLWAWKATSSAVEKKQLQWVAIGTLIGVIPFALLYGVPYLLGLPIASLMEISVLSLCVIPLSFGYAITRYRLMDVDAIFRRGVAYLLASSALLGIYIGTALVIAQTVQNFSPESGFIFLALSALGVALLFAPLKEKIQEQIDRYFFQDQYGYRQSLASFGRALSSEFHLPSLTQKITDRIEKTLNLSPVAIYLREDTKSNSYQPYAIHGKSGLLEGAAVQIPDGFFSEAERFQSHVLMPENDGKGELQGRLPYSFIHIEPLQVRGRVIGFMGLGDRTSGNLLSSEDLDIISGLADYAAIAIDNAILYGSLEAKAEELSALKTYNENVIESITLGVIAVSSEGLVTVWNSAMARLTGVNAQDAVRRHIKEVLPPGLIASIREVVGRQNWLVRQPTRLFKTHLKSIDGESRLIDINLAPVISHSDLNTATLMIIDDITDKVRLENQLLQAEKLSSIGLFAAGLAHEVNTPLAGISSYVQMLLEDTPPDNKNRPHLEKIEKQAFRASDIVNNLLNFARFSESDFEEVNLNSLMLDTLSLLEHQLKKGNIDIHFNLESKLPRTVGHAGKLQQVFMNLFLNAKDAMPRGGELDVSTYQVDSEIVVEIHDSGVGISQDDIKKIYDPFFTTKDIGKGTGLGLSISYGIIQEHSGRIDVDSSPDQGTTFRLSLPLRRIN